MSTPIKITILNYTGLSIAVTGVTPGVTLDPQMDKTTPTKKEVTLASASIITTGQTLTLVSTIPTGVKDVLAIGTMSTGATTGTATISKVSKTFKDGDVLVLGIDPGTDKNNIIIDYKSKADYKQILFAMVQKDFKHLTNGRSTLDKQIKDMSGTKYMVPLKSNITTTTITNLKKYGIFTTIQSGVTSISNSVSGMSWFWWVLIVIGLIVLISALAFGVFKFYKNKKHQD